MKKTNVETSEFARDLDKAVEAVEAQACSGGCTRRTVRSEAQKRYIGGRLNRIAGQMNGVKRMIDEDRYCEDVLVQLSAIDSAIKSLSAYIMEQHMKGCIVNEIKGGNDSAADEILSLFKRFMR